MYTCINVFNLHFIMQFIEVPSFNTNTSVQ